MNNALIIMNQVKNSDYNRYFCSLFFASEIRRKLLALYCFNIELSSIKKTSEIEMIQLIRFAWWREQIEQNSVITPLLAEINETYPTRIKIPGRRTSAEERKCTLSTCAPEVTMFDEPGASFVKGIDKEGLLELIEGYENSDGDFYKNTGGKLVMLASRIAGFDDDQAAVECGMVYAKLADFVESNLIVEDCNNLIIKQHNIISRFMLNNLINHQDVLNNKINFATMLRIAWYSLKW